MRIHDYKKAQIEEGVKMNNLKSLKVVLFFCMFMWVFINHSSAEDRNANAFEFGYSYLAAKLNMPEICEMISNGAFLTAGFGGAGHQISYTKSDCYYHLALETGNPEYCANVIEKIDAYLDGSESSEESCLEEVAKEGGLSSGGGDYELLARFMGYSEKDMENSNVKSVTDFYFRGVFQDEFKEEFKERVENLPDFSQRYPLPKSFSFENIGCESEDDPQWFCHQARCLGEQDEEYREACMEMSQAIRYDENRGRLTGAQQHILKKYPDLYDDYKAGIDAKQKASSDGR